MKCFKHTRSLAIWDIKNQKQLSELLHFQIITNWFNQIDLIFVLQYFIPFMTLVSQKTPFSLKQILFYITS